jgi:hypothetical protein
MFVLYLITNLEGDLLEGLDEFGVGVLQAVALVHIQRRPLGTFRKHSGNIQPTLKEH